jgi:glycosyltransferase involved in cell wall biosynthesis
LYNDFNFINELKPKISHIAVNLGRNKGLHVNANNAIALTRSKYVLIINDDIEILKPFMRECVAVLKHAPYVGSIYLNGNFNNIHADLHDRDGVIGCRTPTGSEYGVGCFIGSSCPVFRKEYWYEVGGYSEDDIYGDIPFNNKGWLKGYFTALLSGGSYARDTDKNSPTGGSEDSSGKFIDVGYANYPKLFGVSEQNQLKMDKDRAIACSMRNAAGRQSGDFNEFGNEGWYKYMKEVTNKGEIDWALLESKYHKRFTDQLKKDLLPRYTKR